MTSKVQILHGVRFMPLDEECPSVVMNTMGRRNGKDQRIRGLLATQFICGSVAEGFSIRLKTGVTAGQLRPEPPKS